MFDNIGGKIKTLAVVICILGMIVSVILGCVMFEESMLVGLIVIAAGCVASWVSSFFVYGFGQLIDDTSAIRDSLRHKSQSGNASSNLEDSQHIAVANPVPTKPDSKQSTQVSSSSWVCKSCGLYNRAGSVCEGCGEGRA